MVVDMRKSQIFKRKVSKLFDRFIDVNLTALNLL